MRYQDKISFEERKKLSQEIIDKYTNRKPVIIYNDENNTNYKFLMLDEHTITILLMNLKKRLSLQQHDSIFLFINRKVIPIPTDNIRELYNEYKDEDGYLYMDVRRENTFG